MSTFQRLIGYIDDATAGGKAYDDLTTGLIPDADKFLPVTTAQVDGQENPLERASEVRGVRGAVAPIEFQANPIASHESIAYPSIVKKLVRLWTGGTDAKTGTPPAAITHKLEPILTGDLPAVHLNVVRDDQFDKVAGAVLNELAFAFPLSDHATVSASYRGKYRKRVTTTVPTAVWTGLPRRGYLLRDAAAFIDGSSTAITQLIRQFNLNLSNSLRDPEWHQKKNRVITPYGSPSVNRTVWWPERHKLGEKLITGQIQFGETEAGEDLKRELAHAQKFVFECEFDDLVTTPVVKEVLRITIWNQVYTGGGPEPLTRSDDITSSYDFGAFIDETSGLDVTFEFVDASNVAIT